MESESVDILKEVVRQKSTSRYSIISVILRVSKLYPHDGIRLYSDLEESCLKIYFYSMEIRICRKLEGFIKNCTSTMESEPVYTLIDVFPQKPTSRNVIISVILKVLKIYFCNGIRICSKFEESFSWKNLPICRKLEENCLSKFLPLQWNPNL